MSSSPQRSRAGNASAAGAGREPSGVQEGSVRAARERLRAIQAVRAQATKSERSPKSDDTLVDKMSPTSPYSPTSQRRAYEQDYDYQEPASNSSWPLPASRYNPAADSSTAARKNRNSTIRNSGTFFDSSSQDYPSQVLQPPQPAFGRSRDGYSPSDPYSPQSAPAPSIPRRTPSSASTASGGGIPDFPLPTSQYQSGRRSQNFVPPQGRSRRGPSSYYSQISGPWGVSPIPEESNSRTTNSYASSNVIPSQMKGFFLDETPSDDDGSTVDFDWSRDGEKIEQNSPGLVRQASLGRRQKPALTTIRSGENLRPPVATPAIPTEVPGARTTRMSQVASILDGESVLLDASSSEQSRRPSIGNYDLSDPFVPPENPKQGFGRMGSPKKGEKALADRRQSKLGGAAVVGSRRPRNIDVQAIREAEARASLTSLPDLIRRATRLAANLERGRTASRLGMDWMLNDDEKPRAGYRPSEGSTLSGMLASFPPPATMPRGQTPSDNDTAEELYKNLPVKRTREGIKDRRNRRQICGLSRRAFFAVALTIFFLVAAAVLLPVFLILLPSRNKTTTTSTAVPVTSALEECQKKSPCMNGGTVVVNLDQSCGCICTNGFTGPSCNVQSNAGCTTVSATGTNSATVGTQVPDLVSAAQTKFSIPLDTTSLSSAFAANNMTCTTENAIVTFKDVSDSKKKRELLNEVRRSDSGESSNKHEPRGSSGLDYAGATATLVASGSAPTTYASSTTNAASSDATASPSAVATSTPTPSAALGSNSTAMQFAKVGILFVLQDSRDLGVAVSAQENLMQFIQAAQKGASSMAVNNITLGSGYFIDLSGFVVTLRNKTQYGVGVNFNGTATGFNNKKRTNFADSLARLLY